MYSPDAVNSNRRVQKWSSSLVDKICLYDTLLVGTRYGRTKLWFGVPLGWNVIKPPPMRTTHGPVTAAAALQ